jgi:hypothetical protein
MERALSEMAAKTEFAALLREVDRVRSLLEDEGSERSLVGDVMRTQLGILQARVRQHCTQHGLTMSLDQASLLPSIRGPRNRDARGPQRGGR